MKDKPEGWTMRDEFAAKAMQGMLAAGANWHDMYKLYEQHEPEIGIAYKIADAMLEARKQED